MRSSIYFSEIAGRVRYYSVSMWWQNSATRCDTSYLGKAYAFLMSDVIYGLFGLSVLMHVDICLQL